MLGATRTTLSSLIEEHLTELISDAISVQRHTKRVRTIQPNNNPSTKNAFQQQPHQHQPPIIASSNSTNNNTTTATSLQDQELKIKKVLDAEDINLALQLRGCEKIYAPNPSIPTTATASDTDEIVDFVSSSDTTSKNAGTKRRVDLNAYITSEIQSQPPFELGLRFHWLAVDGVQPSIPQNPLSIMQLSSNLNQQMIHRIEDDMDDSHLYINANAQSSDTASLVQVSSSNAVTKSQLDTTTVQDVSSNVTIRQLLPRLLSEELQFYFTRITLAIERACNADDDISQQDAALASIRNDAGIQELIPFFSRFVTTQIMANVGNVNYCRLLIRFCDALFENTHVHLELHLHQMLPAIITCIVGRSPSNNNSYSQDHCMLREEASRTLLKACVMFGSQYTTLKSRILKTFVQAIDIRTKPTSTIYGGIIGITVFGPKAIDAFLIPIASFYYKVWDQMLLDEDDEVQILEIRNCQYAILSAVGIFLQHSTLLEKQNIVDLEEFKDIFGEKLIPFYRGPVECDTVLL